MKATGHDLQMTLLCIRAVRAEHPDWTTEQCLQECAECVRELLREMIDGKREDRKAGQLFTLLNIVRGIQQEGLLT